MTESAHLRALLDALIADNPVDAEGYRRISPGAAAWSSVLLEVAQSILPARLTFRDETGSALVLLVRNKRICAMIDASSSGTEAPIGPELDEDPKTVARVAADILAFSTSARQISVRSQLVKDTSSGSQKGILVARLESQLTKISAQPARDQTETIADFLAPVMDHATAWVMVQNGDVVGHSQPELNTKLVQSISVLRGYVQGKSDDSGPRLLVHALDGARRSSSVFAWSEDWVFAANDVGRPSEQLITSWRELDL